MSAKVIKFPKPSQGDSPQAIEAWLVPTASAPKVELTFRLVPDETFTTWLGLHTAKSLRDALDTLIASAEEGAVS